jgi:hypothetical protein
MSSEPVVEEKKPRRLSLRGASKFLGRAVGALPPKDASSTESNADNGSQESKSDGDNTKSSSSSSSVLKAFEGVTLKDIAEEDDTNDNMMDEMAGSAELDTNRCSMSPSRHNSNNNNEAVASPTLPNYYIYNKKSPGHNTNPDWEAERSALVRSHAGEKATLIEENITLKKMMDSIEKGGGNSGSSNWRSTFDDISHMRTKVSVLETELINTHAMFDKMSRDMEMLASRLDIEMEEKGHMEQFYKEKINQYVEYLESKHFVNGAVASSVLTIDDFLRLSAEDDPMMRQLKSEQRQRQQQQQQPSGMDDYHKSRNSTSSKSDSPFGHRGWKTMHQELAEHRDLTNKYKVKKKREKVDGPTTNLVIMTDKKLSPSKAYSKPSFRATHKSTSPELKLSQSSDVNHRNMVKSPPSLKQTICKNDAFVIPPGKPRNCAIWEPEYGTEFQMPNHTLEYNGEGPNVNEKLVKTYEKMGHWASFTSSAKSKLKPAMNPVVGSRGYDDTPFFKLH